MKYLQLFVVLVLLGCALDRPSLFAAQHSKSLLSRSPSPSPSAPVDLDYRIQDVVIAGQPLTINLVIDSPLDSGALQIAVLKQTGLSLLDNVIPPIDLATTTRPLRLTLHVLPTAQTKRSLVLSISVEVGGEQQSRNFRVSLPDSRP